MALKVEFSKLDENTKMKFNFSEPFPKTILVTESLMITIFIK